MEEERRNNVGTLVGLGLMAVLAGIFGFLYFKEHEITTRQARDLESRISELASTQIKIDSISERLEVTIQETEALGGEVTQLKKIRQQLEADRASLRKGSVEMSAKIREYENFLTTKDQDLQKLRTNNQELLSKSENLSNQNEALLSRNRAVTDSLRGIQSKATILEQKVAVGSTPRLSNVEVFAISTKGKIREGERVRSRRADKLRIDFFLEKNPLAPLGSKTIFLRLIDPKGTTISNTETGSGVTQVEGRETLYTTSKDVQFDNTGQKESFVYDLPASLSSGKYTVQLLGEGNLLASGEFSIR